MVTRGGNLIPGSEEVVVTWSKPGQWALNKDGGYGDKTNSRTQGLPLTNEGEKWSENNDLMALLAGTGVREGKKMWLRGRGREIV